MEIQHMYPPSNFKPCPCCGGILRINETTPKTLICLDCKKIWDLHQDAMVLFDPNHNKRTKQFQEICDARIASKHS